MKIIRFLLLSFLFIGNVSCSSDDDSSDIQSLDVAGTWTMTEGFIVPGSMDLDLGGMSIPVEYSGDFINIEDDNRLNFHEDSTFTSVTGDISLEMEMIIMGAPQNQSFEASDLFGQGTWEVIGQELFISNENGTTIKYHIDSVSSTQLKLSSNVKDMDTGEPNPMLESMDIVIKMVFEKV